MVKDPAVTLSSAEQIDNHLHSLDYKVDIKLDMELVSLVIAFGSEDTL
jgi:hypothetical protein